MWNIVIYIVLLRYFSEAPASPCTCHCLLSPIYNIHGRVSKISNLHFVFCLVTDLIHLLIIKYKFHLTLH